MFSYFKHYKLIKNIVFKHAKIIIETNKHIISTLSLS